MRSSAGFWVAIRPKYAAILVECQPINRHQPSGVSLSRNRRQLGNHSSAAKTARVNRYFQHCWVLQRESRHEKYAGLRFVTPIGVRRG